MVKINLKNIFIFFFIVFCLGDIVTTLMVQAKHDVFNEAHPLYILGVSLWTLILVKVFLVFFIANVCIKTYKKMKYPFARYIIIYYVVLMVFLNAAVCVNNVHVYRIPVEDVVVVPDEVKQEFYAEAVGDLGVLKNITPGGRMPFMYLMLIINMIQFAVWRSFEKGIKIKKGGGSNAI